MYEASFTEFGHTGAGHNGPDVHEESHEFTGSCQAADQAHQWLGEFLATWGDTRETATIDIEALSGEEWSTMILTATFSDGLGITVRYGD